MITEQDGPVFAQLVIDQDFEAFQTFIKERAETYQDLALAILALGRSAGVLIAGITEIEEGQTLGFEVDNPESSPETVTAVQLMTVAANGADIYGLVLGVCNHDEDYIMKVLVRLWELCGVLVQQSKDTGKWGEE